MQVFIAVADVQMNSSTIEVCMEVFIAVAYVQINSSMFEVCVSKCSLLWPMCR